jgi:hypothetical protein
MLLSDLGAELLHARHDIGDRNRTALRRRLDLFAKHVPVARRIAQHDRDLVELCVDRRLAVALDVRLDQLLDPGIDLGRSACDLGLRAQRAVPGLLQRVHHLVRDQRAVGRPGQEDVRADRERFRTQLARDSARVLVVVHAHVR